MDSVPTPESMEPISEDISLYLARMDKERMLLWVFDLARRQDDAIRTLGHTINSLPKDDPMYNQRVQILATARKVLERDFDRQIKRGIQLAREME
jgi:hypothetical protein